MRAVTFSGGEIRPRGVPAVPLAGSSPRQTRRVPVEGDPDLQGRQRRRVDGPPDSEEPASVIEVVSGGSEHPQASPQPSEASASQRRVAKRRSLQRREG